LGSLTYTFSDLVALMAKLRAADGCPWDQKQTLQTLQSFLIEESYEVLEAMASGEPDEHCQELGDLLFQIVFQSQLSKEANQFGIEEVVDGIAKKIVRRHPHVFGSKSLRTPAEVVLQWNKIKQEEKTAAGRIQKSVLDGLPAALPALLKAHRLSEKASRIGFDWKNPSEVIPKIREEIGELEEALEDTSEHREPSIAWEIGDLLFALCNLSRHLGFCAEDLLNGANRRFSARFRIVERIVRERGIDMKTADLATLDAIWNEAKMEHQAEPKKGSF
jgi:MazG family protein